MEAFEKFGSSTSFDIRMLLNKEAPLEATGVEGLIKAYEDRVKEIKNLLKL